MTSAEKHIISNGVLFLESYILNQWPTVLAFTAILPVFPMWKIINPCSLWEIPEKSLFVSLTLEL